MCECLCTLMYVCVCMRCGVGVSLYCPKIQAKGNFTGHTHKYLPPTVPPLTLFLSLAWVGGAPAGWEKSLAV